VSRLRKALAPLDAVLTREPGYLIQVGSDELDLIRFERLTSAAQAAPPSKAVQLLREALALWRGPALADLAEEESAQPLIRRLEELRIAALEQRFEAELELGVAGELVGELEELVREHPLRERFRGALMRALYAAGRQAEALDLYRQTRTMLRDELGLEPSPALQSLEQAILRQDPALAGGEAAAATRRRAILVLADGNTVDALLAIAEPLARKPARELILAQLLSDSDELQAATSALAERRATLASRGTDARVSAFTTPDPGPEAVLLATQHDVDLILSAAPPTAATTGALGEPLASVLADAPSDVAVLFGGPNLAPGPVVTPFGGADHDWSAIELAAWLASALDTSLRLVGTQAEPERGRRDASRLLARASMMVQQVVGIVTQPVLVAPGPGGVLEAAHGAALLVVGLSERWRTEGLGGTRLEVAASAPVPTLFVRRGLRPGGLAPNETLTRFTWTLGPPEGLAGAVR
jgi:DNA-binding SARP family transcriptional activator